jgi:hypothetical protein
MQLALDIKEEWSAFNAEQRSKTKKFFRVQPGVMSIAARLSAEPLVRLMRAELHLSSEAWQTDAFAKSVETGQAPDLRVIAFAEGRHLDAFYNDTEHLLTDAAAWTCMPLEGHTQQTITEAFVFLARSIGGTEQLLNHVRESYPVKAFLLLSSSAPTRKEAAGDWEFAPQCMVDDMVKLLRKTWPTAADLVAEDLAFQRIAFAVRFGLLFEFFRISQCNLANIVRRRYLVANIFLESHWASGKGSVDSNLCKRIVFRTHLLNNTSNLMGCAFRVSVLRALRKHADAKYSYCGNLEYNCTHLQV